MKSWKNTARKNTAMVGAASAAMVLLAQACSSGSSSGTSPENDSGGAPDSTSGMDSGVAETSTPVDSSPGADTGPGNVDSGSGAVDSGTAADSGTIVDSGASMEAEAAAPWSPTSLGSSLALWLKPTGVHTGTCPQTASAECVTVWEDSSGNGLLATPVATANPPLATHLACPYITNPSPCVSFTAATYSGLQIASSTNSPLDLTGGFAILAIASAQAGPTPQMSGIYSRTSAASPFQGATLFMPYQYTGHYTASQGFPASQIDDIGDFAIWDTSTQKNYIDNLYHLYVANYDGANSLSIQVDNGTAVSVVVPTTTISATGQVAYVGGQMGQTFNGNMAELLVISGPISTANLASAYAYYSALYGI